MRYTPAHSRTCLKRSVRLALGKVVIRLDDPEDRRALGDFIALLRFQRIIAPPPPRKVTVRWLGNASRKSRRKPTPPM